VLNSKKRTTICSEVAKILKMERKKRRLSMMALAAKAGLSQQMVSYVERGMRNPTLETLLRITDALGIDLAKIIARASKV
jgi:transcriptional regulator with XRE-family HTH domain